MAINVREVVVLGILTSLGLLLTILACVLPTPGDIGPNWWPIFTVLSWILAPFPVLLLGGKGNFGEASQWMYWGYFTTGWLVAASFGIPAVLAHVQTIGMGNMAMTLAACVIVYGTGGLAAYFQSKTDDTDYFAG
eukprot:CAMPEP_0114568482 /NCGR_PEP_ID=MMETSP0114-20121206/16081_1 /TAXON_ID=31324 /ORGANISM="Goniomonas sp, Strain m" /LENGTH=134 /DNA_ID=CAMNT_0001755227 /DNA_START=40 /DNA_END=444 /DNA_ORIENTATION=-